MSESSQQSSGFRRPLTRAQVRVLEVLLAADPVAVFRSNQTYLADPPVRSIVHSSAAQSLVARGLAEWVQSDPERRWDLFDRIRITEDGREWAAFMEGVV